MAVSENYPSEFNIESSYSVVKIPREKIKSVWRVCQPYLQVGLEVAPELTMDAVIDGLSDESIQLWAVLDEVDDHTADLLAVFLTSIERDRLEWVVSLYALGGRDARQWLGECDRIMQLFAVSEGAVRVRMCGRRAWLRLLPKSFAITGMRGGHFVYERDVDPKRGEIMRVKQ